MEILLPQPSTVQADGSDFSVHPDVIRQLLTGEARLAWSSGGYSAAPMDDRHPGILTAC